ncbi:18919_t:CDS:2 [Dentiscutata erythropus]|uniref:18919_t:CDS:1 n=1 Tax=Dentiscutata erythropus TaxID=1348616 RepID=A0A9N9HBU9_9GLOM|nr:18919_t:CDS:2 [Dentiscutata erythropus]
MRTSCLLAESLDGGKNRKGKDKKPLREGTMPDSFVHIMNYFDSNGVKRPKGIRWVLEKRVPEKVFEEFEEFAHN